MGLMLVHSNKVAILSECTFKIGSYVGYEPNMMMRLWQRVKFISVEWIVQGDDSHHPLWEYPIIKSEGNINVVEIARYKRKLKGTTSNYIGTQWK